MKIREGLTWSQHNNKLFGFTDIDRGDEKFLATNILQLFFRN